jgi:cobalt-zinc-cadmium efflux system membrane fusion protein
MQSVIQKPSYFILALILSMTTLSWAQASGSHQRKRISPVSNVSTEHEQEPEDHGKKHGGHGDHEEEQAIRLTQKELEEFGIDLEKAGPGNLDIGVSLPGEVAVNRDRLVHVTSRVRGVVKEVLVHIGDKVEVGDLLAVLASAELGERQIEYLSLKQRAAIARTDLEREDQIHSNTSRALKLLKTAPNLDALHQVMEGRDLGSNRSTLVQAYSQMLLAKTTYDREKSLSTKNISSRAEFLLAESTYKQAKANYLALVDDITFKLKRSHIEIHRADAIAREALEAAERRLQLMGVSKKELQKMRGDEAAKVRIGRVEVRASIHGVVIEKHVALGELLQVENQAFTIVDTDKVWVDLRVYQRDISKIRVGLEVVLSAGHDMPDAEGVISYLAPTVSEDTRTVLARIVLDNPQGLWRPGLFVEGRVRSKETQAAIAIPRTALQTIEGKISIFVKDEDGFEPRPVLLGRFGKQTVEIIRGLASGELYVAKGSFNLKAELGKGGLSSGHSH